MKCKNKSKSKLFSLCLHDTRLKQEIYQLYTNYGLHYDHISTQEFLMVTFIKWHFRPIFISDFKLKWSIINSLDSQNNMQIEQY